MPAYDFKCNICNHKFSVNVPMNERKNVTCPECGKRELTQLFTDVNVMGIVGGSCSTPPGSRFT